MKKIRKINKKIVNYFYDHPYQKETVSMCYCLFFTVLSAAIFSFGFSTFTQKYSDDTLGLVSGGLSGLSQSIVLICTLCGMKVDVPLMQSIVYFVLNVPLLIFAFIKMSKRFCILTVVNVGLQSLFISLFSKWDFCLSIATNQYIVSQPLTRVLLAGACSGFSSFLSLWCDSSSGGADIISAYISNKKGTTIGKYNIAINLCVVLLYACLSFSISSNLSEACLSVLFAVIYFIISSVVLDFFNVRNRKMLIDIITNKEEMPDMLISLFPHSATIIEGKGAYSKERHLIIKMVVSFNETKKVAFVIRKIDNSAFITVSPLTHVYGNFFVRPLR